MTGYIMRRILWIIPVLVVVSLITFVLMHIAPGGPWDREKQMSASAVQQLNHQFNLDKPVYPVIQRTDQGTTIEPGQYLRYVWNAAHGDLGPSFRFIGRNVSEIIKEGWPVTAQLGIMALALALITGIPLGVLAAIRQNSLTDYVAMFISIIGVAVPSFILGILLMVVFAGSLHWLPTSGWTTWQHWILPTVALGAYPTAQLARYTRASMLDVIRQDYVRTARAKGLSEQAVITGHIIKNGLIPVVTILGPITANLVTGSFIIEYLFSVPGIGRFFVQGIFQRDYSMIMGTTLLYAFVVAFMNLMVDLVYGFIDPRIRYR